MNMTKTTIAAAIKSVGGDSAFSGVARILDAADEAQIRFADQLRGLGIADRNAARPFAVIWAAKKHGANVYDGQRGLALDRSEKSGEAAHKAVTRVLAAVYGETFSAKQSSGETDPVAKLFASVERQYAKLSAGQKRSFKAKLAAL